MRQKIKFEKDVKKNTLTVFESSEVDSGVVILLFEEVYNLDDMVQASGNGYQAFTQALRTKKFFPTSDCCAKLFDQSLDFFKEKKKEKLTIEYNDIEAFPDSEEFMIGDDDVEIDKLLEEDGDSKEDEIKDIESDNETLKFKPEDVSEHEN